MNTTYGPLGLGDTVTRSSMVQVGTSNQWKYVTTCNGNAINASFGIQEDGSLWAWGRNTNGVLGLEDAVNRSSPVQVGNLTDWAKIDCDGDSATGGIFAIAIKTDGTLWSWGYGNYGVLGSGTTGAGAYRSSPVMVGTDTNWLDVSVGQNHTLALKTNQTLWAWGRNNVGQLGTGTIRDESSPTQIGSLTNWTKVSAGLLASSAAINSAGQAFVWGYGSSGALGLSDVLNRSSPVQLGNEAGWIEISAGAQPNSYGIRR